eukprot:scaffold7977_cov258-Pinguiococcus_pyrenoidosus.AAC.1
MPGVGLEKLGASIKKRLKEAGVQRGVGGLQLPIPGGDLLGRLASPGVVAQAIHESRDQVYTSVFVEVLF